MKEFIKYLAAVALAVICVVAIVLATNKPLPADASRTIVGEVDYSDEVKVKSCLKDKNCKAMTSALYHEARSESYAGVIAVAQVIKNRASHPSRWASTIHGVIHERWQFSYLWDGSADKGMKDKAQVKRMAIIAHDMIRGKIESKIKNALFYHTVGMKKYPSWSKKKKLIAQVGNHLFYSLN